MPCLVVKLAIDKVVIEHHTRISFYLRRSQQVNGSLSARVIKLSDAFNGKEEVSTWVTEVPESKFELIFDVRHLPRPQRAREPHDRLDHSQMRG